MEMCSLEENSDWILSKILSTFGTFTETFGLLKYNLIVQVHLLVLPNCT